MARLTMCPHYLTDYNLTSPDEIEREIIGPLANCLSKAIELGIEIAISKEWLIKVSDGFPWNRMEDGGWRKYLISWHCTISSFLGKAYIIPLSIEQTMQVDRCSHLQEETIRLFARFLAVFGRREMHGGKHEESTRCQEIGGSFLRAKSSCA